MLSLTLTPPQGEGEDQQRKRKCRKHWSGQWVLTVLWSRNLSTFTLLCYKTWELNMLYLPVSGKNSYQLLWNGVVWCMSFMKSLSTLKNLWGWGSQWGQSSPWIFCWGVGKVCGDSSGMRRSLFCFCAHWGQAPLHFSGHANWNDHKMV